MFTFFIYCYNDNNIYNFIFSNKNENLKKVEFAFFNNQLGCLINRHIIRIMYFTLTVTKYNTLNLEDKNKCSDILKIGTKIFSLLIEKDNYFINSAKDYTTSDNLIKLLLIPDRDKKIEKIKDEIIIIEDTYLKFYNFEADKKDIINEVYNSLERLFSMGMNIDIKFSILKTNYLNIICKLFYIIKINYKYI